MSYEEVGKTLVSSFDGITPQGTQIAATAIQPGTLGALFDGNTAFSVGTNNGPVYSVPFPVINKRLFSLHASCSASGSPNGTLILQATNDVENNANKVPDANLVNWATISFFDEATGATVQSKAIVGAQSYLFTAYPVHYRWVRLKWTNSTGTIKLIAKAQAKLIGGS